MAERQQCHAHAEPLEARRLLSAFALTERAVLDRPPVLQAGIAVDAGGDVFGIVGSYFSQPGYLFEIAAGTSTESTLASFAIGADPQALVVDGNSNAFVLTPSGIQEFPAGGNALQWLAVFAPDAKPLDGLTIDGDGNLFWESMGRIDSQGFFLNVGTIFELPKGSATPIALASTPAGNGMDSSGAPVADAQGNLYGVSANGGDSNDGFIYELHKGASSITALASLSADDWLVGPLVRDAQGNLFATTGIDSAPDAIIEVPAGGHTVDRVASLPHGYNPNLTVDANGDVVGSILQDVDANTAGSIYRLRAGTRAIETIGSFVNAGVNQPQNVFGDGRGNFFCAAETDIYYRSVILRLAPSSGAHLVFAQQPTGTSAGQIIGAGDFPQIRVEIEDGDGNAILNTGADVTLSIASGPAGAKLNGTTTIATTAGVATFGDISVSTDGDYRLKASAPNLTALVSDAFQSATRLAFLNPIDGGYAGIPFGTSLAVAVEDATGSVINSPATQVTLTIASGPAGATLNGTTTVAMAQYSEALFTGVSLSLSGTYTLRASASTAGIDPVVSDPFQVAVKQLAFPTPPVEIDINVPIWPAIVVQVQDANRSIISRDNATVITLWAKSDAPDAASTVVGTATAHNGEADFSGVSFATLGTYTLTATADGAASVTSDPFAVVQAQGSGIWLSSSFNAAPLGAPVVFTATVSVSGYSAPPAATGTVTFFDGATELGSVTLVPAAPAATPSSVAASSVSTSTPSSVTSVTVSFGGGFPSTESVASLTISSLAIGNHVITAQYSGDEAYRPSSAAAINQRITPVTLAATIDAGTLPTSIVEGAGRLAVVMAHLENVTDSPLRGLTTISINAALDGSADYQANGIGWTSRMLAIAPGQTITVPVRVDPRLLSSGGYSLLASVSGPGEQFGFSSDGPHLQVDEQISALSGTILRVTLPPSVVGGEVTRAVAVMRLQNTGNVPWRGWSNISLVASADGSTVDGEINSAFRRLFVPLGGRGMIFVLPLQSMPDLNDGDYHIAVRVNDQPPLAIAPGPTVHVAKGFVQMSASVEGVNVPSVAISGAATNAYAKVNISNQGNISARNLNVISLFASRGSLDDPVASQLITRITEPMIFSPGTARTFIIPVRKFPTGLGGNYQLAVRLSNDKYPVAAQVDATAATSFKLSGSADVLEVRFSGAQYPQEGINLFMNVANHTHHLIKGPLSYDVQVFDDAEHRRLSRHQTGTLKYVYLPISGNGDGEVEIDVTDLYAHGTAYFTVQLQEVGAPAISGAVGFVVEFYPY